MLAARRDEPRDHLSCVVADLEHAACRSDAVAGCEYVLHVPSPLPSGPPSHEDELIVPAREGTRCALRAVVATA